MAAAETVLASAESLQNHACIFYAVVPFQYVSFCSFTYSIQK